MRLSRRKRSKADLEVANKLIKNIKTEDTRQLHKRHYSASTIESEKVTRRETSINVAFDRDLTSKQ